MLQLALRMLQCRSPPSLLGKMRNPREVWISGTSAQHCGILIRAKECSREVGESRDDHPSRLRFPTIRQPVRVSLPFFSLCISPGLCMGGEALAGCQSACGGVNGQPSAHNTLWISDTPRCTNERLQARLVRKDKEMWHSECVCLKCYRYFLPQIAVRLSWMQSTTQSSI